MSLGMLSFADYTPGGPPVLLKHQHLGLMSRRRFVQAAGAAGGLAVASRWLWPSVASATPTASGSPRPIPETLSGADFGDPNNTHVFHILPPLPPQNGQYIEPITIFDFEGAIGRTEVTGTGKGTTQGHSKTYNFDVDMGFMHGLFVGKDGKKHRGTFGFV
jgi:hypothetical protein